MALFKKTTSGATLTIKIDGAAALKRRLEAFGNKITKKAVKEAFKAMAKPIVRSVAAVAPKDLGLLKKAIKFKVIAKSKRTKQQTLRIGPENQRTRILTSGRNRLKWNKSAKKKVAQGKITSGIKSYANPSKYSHLVARGTKHGVKATDYLRKGLDTSKDVASALFIGSMKQSVRNAAQEVKSI